jgi:hypothetical protein
MPTWQQAQICDRRCGKFNLVNKIDTEGARLDNALQI